MKTVARLLFRKDKDTGQQLQSVCVGIGPDLEGIYEIQEILGELVVVKIGESHLGDNVGFHTPDDLYAMGGLITKEERMRASS